MKSSVVVSSDGCDASGESAAIHQAASSSRRAYTLPRLSCASGARQPFLALPSLDGSERRDQGGGISFRNPAPVR